jgi:hypothetical protein
VKQRNDEPYLRDDLELAAMSDEIGSETGRAFLRLIERVDIQPEVMHPGQNQANTNDQRE